MVWLKCHETTSRLIIMLQYQWLIYHNHVQHGHCDPTPPPRIFDNEAVSVSQENLCCRSALPSKSSAFSHSNPTTQLKLVNVSINTTELVFNATEKALGDDLREEKCLDTTCLMSAQYFWDGTGKSTALGVLYLAVLVQEVG